MEIKIARQLGTTTVELTAAKELGRYYKKIKNNIMHLYVL